MVKYWGLQNIYYNCEGEAAIKWNTEIIKKKKFLTFVGQKYYL